MIPETLRQGLWLSLTGLALTFAALGLFILTILALRWIFRGRSEPESAAPAPAEDMAEVAAAIAIALSQVRGPARSADRLGEALEAGRGRWWTAGLRGDE